MLKDLLTLYFVFMKIGAVTFGGGYAMLPILERELVDKRKWASVDDLMDYYAISQVTPGVIAVNVATFVGFRKRSVFGGICATLGVVTPSLIIISLISMFISNFESIVWVQKALSGINVAVTALLTYAVFNFARRAIKKWWGILFYALAFCAIFFLKIPSVIVIIVSAIAGILIAYFSGNLKKTDEEKK